MSRNKIFIILGISIAVVITVLTAAYSLYSYSTLSFSQKYAHQLAKARNLLEDEHSKEVFDFIVDVTDDCFEFGIFGLKNAHPDYFPEYIARHEQLAYNNINPDTKLKTGDTVIDGGVSLYTHYEEKFYYIVGEKGRIIGFEPDTNNVPKIKEKLKKYPNVEIYPYGLWNKKTSMKLWAVDFPPSNIVKKDWNFDFRRKNDDYISANFIKLDDFIKENNIQKLDYIRMNIEGSELEALMGAKNTLKTFKPKLHIFIDQHPTQLFSIILYLNSLNLGYKFYLIEDKYDVFHHTLYASIDN